MNSKQRRKNRATAEALHHDLINRELCTRCGKPGRHFIVTRQPNLEEIMAAQTQGITEINREGFWTCDDLYDPVTKRRLDTSDAPMSSNGMPGMGFLGALVAMKAADREGDQLGLQVAIDRAAKHLPIMASIDIANGPDQSVRFTMGENGNLQILDSTPNTAEAGDEHTQRDG